MSGRLCIHPDCTNLVWTTDRCARHQLPVATVDHVASEDLVNLEDGRLVRVVNVNRRRRTFMARSVVTGSVFECVFGESR